MSALTRSRRPSLEQLSCLLGKNSTGSVPACVFVHGPKSCGKTWLVTRFMEDHGIPFVRIPSQICHYPKHLCDLVVGQVVELVARTGNGTDPVAGTRSRKRRHGSRTRSEFRTGEELLALENCVAPFAFAFPDRKLCIVLDDAEFFLVHRRRSLLASFLSLQEMTGGNVCVVLVSSYPWERFLHKKLPLLSPVTVHVPAFDEDSTVEIIEPEFFPDRDRNTSTGITPNVRRQFLRCVVRSVFHMTNNLSDIRMMVEAIARECLPKLSALSAEMSSRSRGAEGDDDDDGDELVSYRTFTVAAPFIRDAVKRVHLRGIGYCPPVPL